MPEQEFNNGVSSAPFHGFKTQDHQLPETLGIGAPIVETAEDVVTEPFDESKDIDSESGYSKVNFF